MGRPDAGGAESGRVESVRGGSERIRPDRYILREPHVDIAGPRVAQVLGIPLLQVPHCAPGNHPERQCDETSFCGRKLSKLTQNCVPLTVRASHEAANCCRITTERQASFNAAKAAESGIIRACPTSIAKSCENLPWPKKGTITTTITCRLRSGGA